MARQAPLGIDDKSGPPAGCSQPPMTQSGLPPLWGQAACQMNPISCKRRHGPANVVVCRYLGTGGRQISHSMPWVQLKSRLAL